MTLRMIGAILSSVMLPFSVALPESAPANKIAVIGMQSAIASTTDGQKAAAQLNAKYQPKQKDFDQRQREITQLRDQLDKGASLLSAEKRYQLAREVEERKRKLERDISDARDDLNADQQRILQTLGQKLLAVAEQYAKDHGYCLVLDVSSANTPVLYASPTTDITKDIVAQYNKANPAQGAQPSQPSAAAKSPPK
jgi:outer membrane protein